MVDLCAMVLRMLFLLPMRPLSVYAIMMDKAKAVRRDMPIAPGAMGKSGNWNTSVSHLQDSMSVSSSRRTGQLLTLAVIEDSKLVHTMRLEEKAFERWEDPLPCLCIEVGDRETCFKCQEHEACVSSSSQNTCKMCGDAKCGDTGKLNPPPSLGYPKQFRAMIAGDSISQGREGDFTWRYRLWEWLRQSDELSVDFVGPWKGTYPPPDLDTAIPRPPPLQGEEPEEQNRPTQGGKYSQGVSSAFPDRHLSRWGQQARQSKSLVWQAVKDHKPVYLLIELGFNDIGWFVSDADGMLRDLKELVHNAQDGNPDIMVFVANIPHRSRIGGRQDLIDETNKANQKLPEAVKKWFRYDSRVFVVDLAGKYNCGSSDCPDGVRDSPCSHDHSVYDG